MSLPPSEFGLSVDLTQGAVGVGGVGAANTAGDVPGTQQGPMDSVPQPQPVRQGARRQKPGANTSGDAPDAVEPNTENIGVGRGAREYTSDGINKMFQSWRDNDKGRLRGGLMGNVPFFGDVSLERQRAHLESVIRSSGDDNNPAKDMYYRDENGLPQRRFSPSGHVNAPYEWEDPVLGKRRIEAGSNVNAFMGQSEQMQSMRWRMGVQAAGGMLQTAVTPSYTPGGDAAGQAGNMASMWGVANGNSLAAGMGAGAQVISSVYHSTIGTMASRGAQYGQMERPLERLEHIGIGTGGLGGSARKAFASEGADYGYSSMESAHIEAEFTGSIGRKLSRKEFKSISDIPFETDLKGVSRGTAAFYMRNAQYGGGAEGGLDGVQKAFRADMGRAEGMGLRGNGINEMLQRIASTVEGIGQRGLKVEASALGSLTSKLSDAALAGAGGDVDSAIGYGNRAAQSAAYFTQFQADATHALDLPGMKGVGKAMMMSEAVSRARAGGHAGRRGTKMEMERMLRDPGQLLGLAEKRFGGNDEAMSSFLEETMNMSAEQADMYMEGRKKGKSVDQAKKDALGDKTAAGSSQDIMKAQAANENRVVDAIEKMSKEVVEALHTKTTMEVGAMKVGAALTHTAADDGHDRGHWGH